LVVSRNNTAVGAHEGRRTEEKSKGRKQPPIGSTHQALGRWLLGTP